VGLIALVLSISQYTYENNFYFANFRIRKYITKFLSKIPFEIKLFILVTLGETGFWSRDVSQTEDKRTCPKNEVETFETSLLA